jgi:hypothetical protein
MTYNELKDTPFIKASFEARAPLYVILLIQNVSEVAAIDVKLKFRLEPGDIEKTVLFPLLMPHQKVRFLLPEGNMTVLVKKFKLLKLKGECKGVSGRRILIDDTINIKKVIGSWIESDILLEETVENRLSQVADRLERLERSVERMLARTSGVLVKTSEDVRKEIEEMKKFYEERKRKEGEKTSTSG